MACSGIRRNPQPTNKVYPMIGESGFMMIQYVGNEPGIFFGEVTNTGYPFDENPIRFIDKRDALFFLSQDFIEVN